MNQIATQQDNIFGTPVKVAESQALVEVEQSRAVAETQAAMAIAKKFPRNQIDAMNRILQACARPSLADSAMYTYSKGGAEVSGPSIRMAEALAQNWGNIQYGIRELEQRNGESTVEAFAWDIETNTKQVKIFQVPHSRYSKSKGNTKLTDPRDIYEMVANQGARRLRACILGIIPGDVIDAAVNQCEVTMKTTVDVTPERIKSMVDKFAEYKITKAQIEKRIQRNIESMAPAQMVSLGKIYNSIKDGMSSPADWFEGAQVGVVDESKPVTEFQAKSIQAALELRDDATKAAFKDMYGEPKDVLKGDYNTVLAMLQQEKK